MSKSLAAVLALALFLSGAGAGAAEPRTYRYNFQSAYAGPHVLNTQMYLPWLDELAEKSDNRLILDYFMNGALVRAEDIVPALMNGNLDLGGAGPDGRADQFIHTLTFMMPYIARDSVQASELYWQAYTTVPEVKAELDRVGKILTVWGSDRSGLFSTKGPILSPSDLKGKKVLIWNPSQAAQVEAWGATPVPVAALDTLRALQRGAGDVFFGPLPTGVAYKLMNAAKDVTILPASSMLMFNAVSWNVWNELPPDLRQLLVDSTGHEASVRSGRLLYDATNKDLETMRRAGISIHELTPVQEGAFRQAERQMTVDNWRAALKSGGSADPDAEIRRAYDMADAMPGATDAR